MDHNYCIPGNEDPSELQDHACMDIVSKKEEDNVLLPQPENIEEATKQVMTSSMVDGVLWDNKMYGFSREIDPNCNNFVGSKQIEEHVKSMDHEANAKECCYSPQYDRGFKMEAESLNEEFDSDGHFEKPYSIEQPDVSGKEYVIPPQKVWKRISVKTEDNNENFVCPPQHCDELVKMEETEATSVEFVSSPQIVANVQSKNTSEGLVNWPHPLQAITKVNHDPQGATVKIDPGLSGISDRSSEPSCTCSICGTVVKTQAFMTFHITQFHNTKLIFKCYICEKTFLERSSLTKHNLTHVETCGICGEKFNWLSLHMLSHTGERPHRCLVCGKVFIAKANSNTGSSNLVSTNKNGFYDCGICEKEIISWQYFTLHMKKHTLTQTHLTCICSTTHASSSDTKILMTSTQNASYKSMKTYDNIKHNEEHGKVDVNEQNPCRFCDHGFQSQFELHQHLLTHFKGRVQDCSVCVHGFTSEELLLKHLINHIESSMYDSCAYVTGVQQKKQAVILDKEKWGTAVNSSSKQCLIQQTAGDPNYEQLDECDLWQKAIIKNSNITEYKLTCIREHPDKCGVCGKVFIHKDYLRAHILTHTTRPHICHVCGKGFTKNSKLTRHIVTHRGECPYKCRMCGKQFETKDKLKLHMFTHNGEHSQKCSICGKCFTSKSHLTRHMLFHPEDCLHTCSVCGKRFREKGSLTTHMLTHTAERPYQCSVCGKGFIHKSDLRKHMLTHTGERPHKCDVCGKRFTAKNTLTSHILTHIEERPHMCGVCAKGFTQKRALTNHMMTHTGECRHTCSVCGKGFRHKPALTYHLLTHTGELPHKCSMCGNRFRSKSNLTRHILTHTGGECPHKCAVCGSGFRLKSHLCSHSFIHV